MSQMFYGVKITPYSGQTYSLDLSGWNVSNVTNMYRTFDGASASDKWYLNVSTWDTSSVTNMYGTFNNTNIVADCSKWNVTNVTWHDFFDQGSSNVTPPHWVN